MFIYRLLAEGWWLIEIVKKTQILEIMMLVTVPKRIISNDFFLIKAFLLRFSNTSWLWEYLNLAKFYKRLSKMHIVFYVV